MRPAIALLITLMFVMMITVAIGVGLKQVKEATNSVENESFMLETSMILDDVLNLLKQTKELDNIVNNTSIDSSITALNIFLAQSAFIPFESSGVKIVLELSSARAKFNPNALVDANSTDPFVERVNALENYLNEHQVESEYVNMMLDIISGEGSYYSDITSEKPLLFRDYITSKEHLNEVSDSYLKLYRNSAINKVAFDNLFYFTKDRNSSIDLNYATVDVWQMILKCDRLRAEQLNEEGGFYTKVEDLELTQEEHDLLNKFQVSYFEPYLDVNVEIIKGKNNAKIRFEYDMKEKKGSNFIYEI